MRSSEVKNMNLKNELCHRIYKIHYLNTKNYENTKLTRLNNLQKWLSYGDSTYKNIWNINKFENNSYNREMQIQFN